MGLGMTGFAAKRDLVIESTALRRDFLPVLQGLGAAGRDRQGPVAGGCANFTTPLGRFLGGSKFHTLALGCVRMDKTSGYTVGKPRHQGHELEKIGGVVQGSLCPLLSIH